MVDLTTEQAEIVSEFVAGRGHEWSDDRWGEWYAFLDAWQALNDVAGWENWSRSLARWVLLNAPVVRAAEAQTDAADAIRVHDWTEYDEGLAFAAADTSRATEAAVRAARPQPQEDTDA